MYFGTRPQYLPPTRMERLIDLLSLAAVIFSVLFIAFKWNQLPPEIATHFDAQGNPDEWGAKISLLEIPVLQVVMVWIPMTLIRRFPNAFIYFWQKSSENAQGQYLLGRMHMGWLKLEIILFLAMANWHMVSMADNHYIKIFPAAIIILLIVSTGTTIYYHYLSNKMG